MGINKFVYVDNNSINYIDPWGLWRKKAGGYRFEKYPDDHPPDHVHVYKDNKKLGKYDLENKCPMDKGLKDSKRLRKALKKLGLIGLGVTILDLGFDIHESGAQEAVGNMVGDMVDNIVNPFFGASEAE